MADKRVSLIRRTYRKLMRLQRRLLGLLPPQVAARLSPPFPRPKPFNGQSGRAAIAHDISGALAFDAVIETGTFKGATTRLLAQTFGAPVCTVEFDPRYHAYSRRRLSDLPDVTLTRGDSRDFLRGLAAEPRWRDAKTVFAYLDAHWEEDLPLAEELRIIASTWPRAVVMIDDFQVPDDPGYGFDDYGPRVGALTTELLPPEVASWQLLFPSLPAAEENGRRRGCCVLVSPEIQLPELSTLRSV